MNLDRRAIIAIAICVLFMLLSSRVVNMFWPAPPPQPVAEAPEAGKGPKAPASRPSTTQPGWTRPAKPVSPADTQPQAVPAAQAPATQTQTTARTQPARTSQPTPDVPLQDNLRLGGLQPPELFEAQLTNVGARVSWMKLGQFADGDDPDHPPLRVLAEEPPGQLSFGLQLLKPEPVDLTTVRWEVVRHSPREVVFRTTALDVAITKTFRLFPEPRYSLQMLLVFENRTAKPIPLVYTLDGPFGLPKENQVYSRVSRYVVVGERNPDGTVDYNYKWDYKVKEDEGYKTEWANEPIQWAGVDSQYFSAVVIPDTNDKTGNWIASVETLAVGDEPGKRWSPVTVRFRSDPALTALGPAGGPQATRSHAYRIFAGPKIESVVQAEGVSEVRTYGGFAPWISRIMVSILVFFHAIIPSYGIAIILLTITVRLAMLYLSLKQHKSMHKMQGLQPEIQRINREIKDKQQRGQATMELYRREGVNPFAGCLPMFVQLPIFIGLYQGLLYAFELRQQSFLWIRDLARPDMLFSFGFDIPWLGRYFNLLPLLTVVLMVVQQRTSQKPTGDPQQDQQRKIMTFMMVFVGFLFYWVASGLCLYFISSSLIHLVEQKLIGAWLGEHPSHPKPKATEDESSTSDSDPKRDQRRMERAAKKRDRQRKKQGRTRK